MKSKTIFKILLDIAMTVIYVLLMFGYDMGAVFHELAGILVGLLFMVHVLINVDLIKGLFRRIEQGPRPTQALLLAISDLLLIFAMPLTILTGVLISGVIFSFPGNALISWIHNAAAFSALGAMGLHLLLHLSYLKAVIKGIVKNFGKNPSAAWKAGGAFAALMFLVSALFVSGFVSLSGDVNSASVPVFASPEVQVAGTVNSKTTAASEAQKAQNDSASKTTISGTAAGSSNADKPTLQEYLSKLFCNACSKHCPLSNPRCGKASAAIAQAKANYQSQFTVTAP